MAENYEKLLLSEGHAPSAQASMPATFQDLSGAIDDMGAAAVGYLLPGLVSEFLFGGEKSSDRKKKYLERFKEKNKHLKAAKAQMWVSVGTFLATYWGTQWMADREYAQTGDVPRNGLKGWLWEKRPQLVMGVAIRAIRDILDANLDINAKSDSWSSKLRRIMTLTPPKGELENASVFYELVEDTKAKKSDKKETEGIGQVLGDESESIENGDSLLPLDLTLPPEYQTQTDVGVLPQKNIEIIPQLQTSQKKSLKEEKKDKKSVVKEYYKILKLR